MNRRKPTPQARQFCITPSKGSEKPSAADHLAFGARREAERKLEELKLQRQLQEVF